jgi:pilus assembly protein CpaE
MGASRRTATERVFQEVDRKLPPVRKVERRPLGKLLMVYSPKGGTGCSIVASNLAIALSKTTRKKVALVDGNLQFGDSDVLLNLQGNRTIVDIANRIDELDSDLMNVMTASHPSGIRVLAAPPTPVAFERISTDTLKKVLSQLKKDFDYVLLDTWSRLDDTVLGAIDLADRILVVMTPEIPSIKSTKLFFDIAEALEYPIDQIDLILNKVIPRDGLRADKIESSMQHRVLAELVFDPKQMRQAINQGSPLVMLQPNHPLSQSFLQLAEDQVEILKPQPEEVQEESEPKQPELESRGGLFGRLRK